MAWPRNLLVATVVLAGATAARAEEGVGKPGAATAPPAATAESGVPRIRDNLFLLEEAYNQEPGVIQHIQVFQIGTRSRDWIYSFTEEWPVPDDLNQLSVTLPVVGVGGTGTVGLGDVLLNWRIQAIGLGGKGRVAVAPRLSVVFPSGSVSRGHGRGAFGIQLNFPASIEAGRWFVIHVNVGTTLLFDAEDTGRTRSEFAVDASAGAAVVWQPLSWFNALVEVAYQNIEDVLPSGSSRAHDLVVNPGIRFAIDHQGSGLQVVPGVSAPMRAYPTGGFEPAVLAYLSFEHPLW